MRVVLVSTIRAVAQYQSSRWLQAGFSSFAYRLAHLTLPRAAATCAAAVVFLLV